MTDILVCNRETKTFFSSYYNYSFDNTKVNVVPNDKVYNFFKTLFWCSKKHTTACAEQNSHFLTDAKQAYFYIYYY